MIHFVFSRIWRIMGVALLDLLGPTEGAGVLRTIFRSLAGEAATENLIPARACLKPLPSGRALTPFPGGLYLAGHARPKRRTSSGALERSVTPSVEHEIRDLRSRFWSERDPEGRGFVPLADALRRSGAPDEALELLDEGLARHPSFASAHLVRSWVHHDRGDLAEAEEALRRVLDLDPENARALHGLGQLLARVGRVPVGRELVVRALELDPLLEWEEGGAPGAARIAHVPSDGVVDIRALAPRSPDGILGDPDGLGPLVEIAYLAPPDAGGLQMPATEGVAAAGEDAPVGQEAGGADLDEMPDPWAAPIVAIDSLAPEPGEQPIVDVASLAPVPVEQPGADATAEQPSDHERPTDHESHSDHEAHSDHEPPPDHEADSDHEPPSDIEAHSDIEAPSEHEPPSEHAPVPVPARELEPGAEGERDAVEEPMQFEVDDDEVHLTRTMIELMERQGLHAQALDVARRLLARDPDDATLARRVAELEAGGEQAAEPIIAPAAEHAAERTTEPAAEPIATAPGRDEASPSVETRPSTEAPSRAEPPPRADAPPLADAGIADYLRDVLSWPDPSGGGEGR
jgi:tetratricopeptide (TPR) repeat protein